MEARNLESGSAVLNLVGSNYATHAWMPWNREPKPGDTELYVVAEVDGQNHVSGYVYDTHKTVPNAAGDVFIAEDAFKELPVASFSIPKFKLCDGEPVPTLLSSHSWLDVSYTLLEQPKDSIEQAVALFEDVERAMTAAAGDEYLALQTASDNRSSARLLEEDLRLYRQVRNFGQICIGGPMQLAQFGLLDNRPSRSLSDGLKESM